MSSKILVFVEYKHVDWLNDKVHHPYLILDGDDKGQWRMTDWTYPLTLKEVGTLCNIPSDDLTVIALQYGP